MKSIFVAIILTFSFTIQGAEPTKECRRIYDDGLSVWGEFTTYKKMDFADYLQTDTSKEIMARVKSKDEKAFRAQEAYNKSLYKNIENLKIEANARVDRKKKDLDAVNEEKFPEAIRPLVMGKYMHDLLNDQLEKCK